MLQERRGPGVEVVPQTRRILFALLVGRLEHTDVNHEIGMAIMYNSVDLYKGIQPFSISQCFGAT